MYDAINKKFGAATIQRGSNLQSDLRVGKKYQAQMEQKMKSEYTKAPMSGFFTRHGCLASMIYFHGSFKFVRTLWSAGFDPDRCPATV